MIAQPARVVPACETWQIFGNPDVVMAFLAQGYAPPTLVTAEGDPLVIGEALLEVSDSGGRLGRA